MIIPVSVLHQIIRDYEPKRHKAIEILLLTYGEEPFQQEQERVLLDILKLAKGDENELTELLARAKKDYRDIIFWAEYPEESRLDTSEKVEAFNKMVNRYGNKAVVLSKDGDT